jgi:hypothetical protein
VALKRVHYFDHQFLKVHDFQAEQEYHTQMRRQHNRLLHGWGVVEGLEVKQKGQRDVTIEPGMAIDNLGREIVIASLVPCQLISLERNTHVFIALGYDEFSDELDHYSSGGIEDYTRVTEAHKIEERKEPARDGSVITLARVHLNENGHILRVETNVRTMVASRLSAGWVRLPFKPVRMELLRIGEKLVRPRDWDPSIEFITDVGSAYCGEQGARGTMQIPVPPGASRVTHFRICGTTQRRLELEWARAGWSENKGDYKTLVKRVLDRAGDHEHFDENVEVNGELQQLTDSHSLAISVIAEGTTTIWLVAARFE